MVTLYITFQYESNVVDHTTHIMVLICFVFVIHRADEDSEYPPDATIHASKFVTRNYTLSTTTAQIALIVADGTKVKVSSFEPIVEMKSLLRPQVL